MPSAPPRRLLVIANPTAGQGASRRRRLKRCLDLLTARGCAVTLHHTDHRGHAEELARAAQGGGFDAVVAAGGDGTINEVVNGMVGGTIPLGILPLGTANVLAIELGLSCRPEAVAAAITGGACQRVQLGRVNGRHFLQMAGAGIDAEVVAGVDLALKRHTGKLAYVLQTLRSAWRYPYPPLTITIDGQVREGYGVVVCNGRHYGGPFIAAPAARLDQPGFQVCLLGRPGLGGTLRAGTALMLGALSRLPEVTLLPAHHVIIEGVYGAPVQGDGDIIAHLPVDISVAGTSVSVLRGGRG